MKFYNKGILFLLISLLFVGCSEDFLNEPAPTATISESVVFQSRDVAEAVLSGMVRISRGQFTTGHDAGGINSIHFARAAKGDDLVIGTSWFRFDYEQENHEPTYRRTVFTWQFCYEMISQANTLINGALASESLSDADKNYLVSQGLAFRAYYYHQLILEFGYAYTLNPDHPAIPIYTEVVTEGNPLSTVREVYDLIISDLTTARSIATDYRLDKSYININVINAMLADVYLCTENWSGAAEAARNAYQGYPLNAAQYSNGFNNLDASEWIWGYYQYDDQSNYYYGAPHSQADHTVLSYQNMYVNGNFVNSFSDTDVRKRFIGGYYGGSPSNWNYWISNKFAFADFGVDFPLYRTPEMMLVEAEAKARQGDDAGARTLLFQVQSNRDPNAVNSNFTGNQLINEILFEKRKEVYGEKGAEWFDAKRLQRGIEREGNHRVFAELAPNDRKFLLKIPQVEFEANPHFDASVNNHLN